MPKDNLYKIPTSGQAREQLREKGQFWTPDWVAEAMVEYVLTEKSNNIFDPAVGAGAFFRAAKAIAIEKGCYVMLSGMDIDPTSVDQSILYGLNPQDLAGVKIGDFVFEPPTRKLSAIVANPPYIRHHRIPIITKERLKRLSLETIGKTLDGRAGLHIYFLLRALSLLQENGRLAFIMPADTCEGKFANDLWSWIGANFRLDAVVTFEPGATPFPNVDTNPLVFFIRNAAKQEKFWWVKCYESNSDNLKRWVRSGFDEHPIKGLNVFQRELVEALGTGLSRPLLTDKPSRYVLGDFVRVVRGVATGSNEFFFMTEEKLHRIGIPQKYFVRAIGRTRDILTKEITQGTLDLLSAKGRPTYLLALDGRNLETYPQELKEYLKNGEAMGLPKRPLISQRDPWYKTESRAAPPFLFAYLGRRNSRFIRNTASIIPLTSFLCVYPKSNDKKFVDALWGILDHPDILANLAAIAKSYGDGALKVEPRSLEKLPIPNNVIEQFGVPTQMRLFDQAISYKHTLYPTRKNRKSLRQLAN